MNSAVYCKAAALFCLLAPPAFGITCTTPLGGPVLYVALDGSTEQVGPLSISCVGSYSGTLDFFITAQNGNTTLPITNAALGTSTAVDISPLLSGFQAGATASVVRQDSNTLHLTVSGATSSDSQLISIPNVRVNPSGLAVANTVSLAVIATQATVGVPSSATVAIVAQTLQTPTFTVYPNVSVGSASTADINAVGTVRIATQFAGAFTTDAEQYARESSASGLNGNPITQATTRGSRLALTFQNLATSGVTYYLPTTIYAPNTVGLTSVPLTMNLVPASDSACGVGPGCSSSLAGTTIGGSQNNGNTGQGASLGGMYPFTPVSGAFTAYYAVSSDYISGQNTTGDFNSTVPIPSGGTLPSITLYEKLASGGVVVSTSPPTVSITVRGADAPYYAQALSAAAYAATGTAPDSSPGNGGELIPSVAVTAATLPGATGGAAYSQQLAATGGTGTYSTWSVTSGSLPPGVSLGATSGLIAGTATGSPATYTFSVMVTDSSGSQSLPQSFSIAVGKATQTITLANPGNTPLAAGTITLTPSSNAPGASILLTAGPTSVCTVSGSVVSLISMGLCSVTANSAAIGNYLAAPAVTVSFYTVFAGSSISADTTAPAGVSVFGCGTTIAAGATLTISPGAIIKFVPGCLANLRVLGYLVANGTASNPIVFTSAADDSIGGDTNSDGAATSPARGDWQGISFENPNTTSAKSSSLSQARLYWAGRSTLSGPTPEPAAVLVSTGNSQPALGHLLFKNNQVGINYYSGSTATLASSDFQSNGTGILVSGGAAVTVTQSNFQGNTLAISNTNSATPLVTATGNYWNSASGPGAPGGTGSGDPVSTLVNFASPASALIPHSTQTIIFTPPSAVLLSSGSVTLSATATSGLPVVFSTTSLTCSISGATVTLNGPGNCVVSADQPGDSNWTAAPTVSATITITQLQNLGVQTLQNVDLGSGPVDLVVTSDSNLPVTVTSNTASVCTVSGTTITPVIAGNCSVTVSQPGSGPIQAATPVTQTFTVFPALVIGTSTLAGAAKSSTYSQTLSASGGDGNYQWSVATGSLPDGLSISGSTLKGTPGSGGLFVFTLQVTDGTGWSARTRFSINVNAALIITTTSLADATRGTAYSQALTATGGSGSGYTWGLLVGPTPTGVTLAQNGLLTGKPLVSGAFPLTIQVTDSLGAQSSKSFTLNVVAGLTITTTSLAPAAQGVPYSQSIVASGGAGTPLFAISNGNLPNGLMLSANGLITGVPTGSTSTFTVKATDSTGASATATFILQVNTGLIISTTSLPTAVQGLPYSKSLTATGGTGNLSWKLLAGQLPQQVNFGADGSISGTPRNAGQFSFTVQVSDRSGATTQAALSITVNPPLQITTKTLPAAVANSLYQQTLTASGGVAPYSWSIASGSPPAGIVFAANGSLNGTAKSAGSAQIAVVVTDQNGGSAMQSYTINVNGALTITSGALLPAGITGSSYQAQFTASGGSDGAILKWTLAGGTLPPGITLSASGALNGNPNTSGTFQFSVQVTDGQSTATLAGATIVVQAALSITTSSLPNAIVGQAYGPVQLAAQGGAAQSKIQWAASGLPGGITVTGNTLSGTVAASATTGPATVTVTAFDPASSQTAIALLILNVVSGTTLSISPAQLTLGAALGNSISGRFSALPATSGSSATLTWSVAAGTLPVGVTLDPTSGLVSGTPSGAGNAALTISVSDGRNAATAQLTIKVLGLGNARLPNAAVTVPYSGAVPATGGTRPYVFSATGVPSGLMLAGDGSITGTPTAAGPATIQLTVSDSQGLTFTAPLSLTVKGAPVSVQLLTLPPGSVGAPYSQIVSATGGVPGYTWTTISGALPPGLSLSASGTISGNPTKPGSSAFTLQATDTAGGVASAQALITINPSPITITTTALPSGVAGLEYPEQVLGVTGGQPPYTFAITSGSLPAGLNLVNNSISGIADPLSAGSWPLTLSVQDSTGLTASTSLTLVIRPNNPDLLLNTSGISLVLSQGSATFPPRQIVGVQSTTAGTPVNYSLAIDPPSSWLGVSSGTSTPDQIVISLAGPASSLVAGVYSANVNLTCQSTTCQGNTQTVLVSLNVTSPPPQLSTTTTLLSFGSSSTPPIGGNQPLDIANSGGGSITGISASCEASWCTVSGVPSSLGAGAAATLAVTVNPTGLPNVPSRTAVDISTSAGVLSIPVVYTISQQVSMSLAPAGSRFSMQQNGAPGNPNGSFLITTTGTGASWSATIVGTAQWLTLNTPAGSASATQPATVAFSINSSAAGLPAGTNYATIRVISPDVANSPQDYEVILDISQATTAVRPDPQPAGLLFISTGSSPAAQVVSVYSPSATQTNYQVSASSTSSGGTGSWLSVTPATGTMSAAAPGQSTVSVDTTGLTPGVYTGTLSYSSTGAGIPAVNVTLVVAGAASLAASNRTGLTAPAPADSCSASSLVAAPTGLAANFSAPTSWPTPLAIYLVNNCGSLVTDGQVTATFSNGDPPLALALVNPATGLYSATWTPRGAASQVTVSLRATSGSGLAPATAQISGAVTPNSVPSVTPLGTVNPFNAQLGGALAPGTIMTIYGANMASATGQPASIPLATSLNGTSVIVGGLEAPLYYVSPEQINVQVPFELDPAKQYQVVVSANGAIATPQTIQMSTATPGIAAFGDGTIIAQHAVDGSLVLANSPAQPGEYIVIYLLGMGQTNTTVASGTASPADPLALPQTTPTVTIGSRPVPVAFAGLTPGLVGLYQINIQLPDDLAPGNQTLIVTQASQASNSTILPVQQ